MLENKYISGYFKNIINSLRKGYLSLFPYFRDMFGYFNTPYEIYFRGRSIRENVKCLMLDGNFLDNEKEYYCNITG